MRDCTSCGTSFDPRSTAKREAGGLISHCPDCAQDVPRYLGVGDGTGKQTEVQVLKFATEQDREAYARYWAAASGMHNGKSCHMAYLPSPRQGRFQKITDNGGNRNHKGKL